jgi:hypothetical protein
MKRKKRKGSLGIINVCVSDSFNLEKKLINIFGNKFRRVHGEEWFKGDPRVMAQIIFESAFD